jgi:hypothetical protein
MPSQMGLRWHVRWQARILIGQSRSPSLNWNDIRMTKVVAQSSHLCTMYIGCPRNKQIFFSVRTETYRNTICFGWFLVCFAKPKNYFFGLFRCFGPVLKQPKLTDLFRNKLKQTEKTKRTKQSCNRKMYDKYMYNRGGRFLDFLDFQPAATGGWCKMLF